jgi:hypothetical protein
VGSFWNGLKNIGSTIGNYEMGRMARYPGLYGALGRRLGGGVSAGNPPAGSLAPSSPVPDISSVAPPDVMNPPPALGDSGDGMNDASGAAPQMMAKGGIATKPTLTTIAENEPEMVVKLPGGRYKSNRKEAA